MRQRVLALSFILKIFQGLLAYMNIILQNRSLSNLEFNHLSIIGNAILLSVFWDFGVGTKFVQNYLSYKANCKFGYYIIASQVVALMLMI